MLFEEVEAFFKIFLIIKIKLLCDFFFVCVCVCVCVFFFFAFPSFHLKKEACKFPN
jgi:hypothetical protein